MYPAEIEERMLRQRNINACDKLLDRLRKYHGAEETKIPDESAPGSALADAPHICGEPPSDRPWFSIISDDEPAPITVSVILNAVSRYFKVSKVEITSERRDAKIVRARQVAYYLSKKLTPRSLPDIGRRIGDRDHTSVLAGVRKIERLRCSDPKLEVDLHAIANAIGGSLG